MTNKKDMPLKPPQNVRSVTLFCDIFYPCECSKEYFSKRGDITPVLVFVYHKLTCCR